MAAEWFVNDGQSWACEDRKKGVMDREGDVRKDVEAEKHKCAHGPAQVQAGD